MTVITTVSLIDTRYAPVVISLVLILRNSAFIDEFSIKKTPVVSLPFQDICIIEKLK